ncbi:MAG: hypothetical protein GEV08_01205 [Acidimicrobiia bacterium]|nr:hypothetical protein [Acidimicrobiia bacterium]
MPESLTPDLVALRDRVATLAAEVLVPLRDDTALEPAERARRTREASKAAGLFTMAQPAAAGGSAASALALVVARDTLGQHDVGHLPGLFGPGPGVLGGVGEPLRTSHLLPLLAGEKRGGFAFTEPVDAPRQSWARVEGDELVINGQKSYVTGGGDADFVTALVVVEGRGPAMVVVDARAPGVTLTRRFGTLDGSHHAAFAFEEVRVPVSNLVGEPGQGLTRALGQIGDVRLAIAANCVGTAGWVVGFVTAHLLAPRRNGEPLGSHERVRLRYGDMCIRAYAARSMLYRTARIADRGENAVNEAIATKVFATETVGELVDMAIQLVGGEALVEGHPLEAAYRRVRSLRLAEGESDTLRVNVARGRLELDKGRI